jgi:hypothetical protein
MKTVTSSKAAEADRHAAEILKMRVREAEAEGNTLDLYDRMLIHEAAWIAITGANAVKVEGD